MMKKVVFLLLFIIFFCAIACTHDKDTWSAFYNQDSTLIGFKNKAGVVKIEPRFTNNSVAGKLDDIIAISHITEPDSVSYYLTKKGRMVGRDSLYWFDYTPDCESEGFIRFRDPKTKKMGMFNANGDIAIPALYNYLSPVRNGFIMAWKGGVWSEKDISEHNEYPWKGGENLLIDINNQVLINDFAYDEDIDFFSADISEQPNKDPIRKSFKASDGKYYSFIHFEKEFSEWLQKSLLNDLSVKNILEKSFEKITADWNGRGPMPSKEEFVRGNFLLLKSKLLQFSKPGNSWFLSNGQLDFYNYDSKEYEKYFDNCGHHKNWIYPVIEIITTFKSEDIKQDQFAFLRTSEGYKLIGASMSQPQ